MAAQKYAIIGDSHECVEEAQALVLQIENKYPDAKIVWVGDYLDKGHNTKEMVEFIYRRVLLNEDEVVRGNHEKFVYGRLEGILGALEDPVKEDLVFGSQKVLLADPELARKFASIYEKSVPYFIIEKKAGGIFSPHLVPTAIVTHAPCKAEHLGLDDPASIRAQSNYRTLDRTISTAEDLKWFYDDTDADWTEVLHIFGHMAHSGKTLEQCQYKHKVFLDTGCVYGNGLSAVVVCEDKILDYLFQPSVTNRQPQYTLSEPLGRQ